MMNSQHRYSKSQAFKERELRLTNAREKLKQYRSRKQKMAPAPQHTRVPSRSHSRTGSRASVSLHTRAGSRTSVVIPSHSRAGSRSSIALKRSSLLLAAGHGNHRLSIDKRDSRRQSMLLAEPAAVSSKRQSIYMSPDRRQPAFSRDVRGSLVADVLQGAFAVPEASRQSLFMQPLAPETVPIDMRQSASDTRQSFNDARQSLADKRKSLYGDKMAYSDKLAAALDAPLHTHDRAPTYPRQSTYTSTADSVLLASPSRARFAQVTHAGMLTGPSHTETLTGLKHTSKRHSRNVSIATVRQSVELMTNSRTSQLRRTARGSQMGGLDASRMLEMLKEQGRQEKEDEDLNASMEETRDQALSALEGRSPFRRQSSPRVSEGGLSERGAETEPEGAIKGTSQQEGPSANELRSTTTEKEDVSGSWTEESDISNTDPPVPSTASLLSPTESQHTVPFAVPSPTSTASTRESMPKPIRLSMAASLFGSPKRGQASPMSAQSSVLGLAGKRPSMSAAKPLNGARTMSYILERSHATGSLGGDEQRQLIQLRETVSSLESQLRDMHTARKLESDALRRDADQLRAAADELRRESEELREQRDAIGEDAEGWKQRFVALREGMSEKLVAEKEKALAAVAAEREAAEARARDVAAGAMREAREAQAALAAERAAKEAANQLALDAQAASKEAATQLATLARDNASLANQLNALPRSGSVTPPEEIEQESLRRAALEHELEEFKLEMDALRNEMHGVVLAKEDVARELGLVQVDNERLRRAAEQKQAREQEERDSLREECNMLKGECSLLKEERNTLKESLASAQNSLASAHQNLDSLRAERDTLLQEKVALQQECDTLRHEKVSLLAQVNSAMSTPTMRTALLPSPPTMATAVSTSTPVKRAVSLPSKQTSPLMRPRPATVATNARSASNPTNAALNPANQTTPVSANSASTAISAKPASSAPAAVNPASTAVSHATSNSYAFKPPAAPFAAMPPPHALSQSVSGRGAGARALPPLMTNVGAGAVPAATRPATAPATAPTGTTASNVFAPSNPSSSAFTPSNTASNAFTPRAGAVYEADPAKANGLLRNAGSPPNSGGSPYAPPPNPVGSAFTPANHAGSAFASGNTTASSISSTQSEAFVIPISSSTDDSYTTFGTFSGSSSTGTDVFVFDRGLDTLVEEEEEEEPPELVAKPVIVTPTACTKRSTGSQSMAPHDTRDSTSTISSQDELPSTPGHSLDSMHVRSESFIKQWRFPQGSNSSSHRASCDDHTFFGIEKHVSLPPLPIPDATTIVPPILTGGLTMDDDDLVLEIVNSPVPFEPSPAPMQVPHSNSFDTFGPLVIEGESSVDMSNTSLDVRDFAYGTGHAVPPPATRSPAYATQNSYARGYAPPPRKDSHALRFISAADQPVPCQSAPHRLDFTPACCCEGRVFTV